MERWWKNFMLRQKKVCDAVQSVAWGYILIHLDVNLGRVSILPDWLGYLLILEAIPVLAEEVRAVELLRSFCKLLALWKGVLWVAALPGFSIESYLLTALVAVIDLYFHFQLMTNLAELAEKWNCPQQKKILVLRTVRTILTTFLMLPVKWQEIEGLAIAMILVQVVLALWLCAVMVQLKWALEE